MHQISFALALALLAVLGPARAQTTGDVATPEETRGLPGVTPIGLRAVAPALPAPSVDASPLGVHAWTPAPDEATSFASVPGADVAFVVAPDTVEGPTLDSLRMSVWERLWWGRRGVFRRARIFPTHPDDHSADFRQIAAVRRRMLEVHGLLGLATVGMMTAHVVAGQVAIGGGDARVHRTLAPVTIGLYSATAALSLLSPPPLYSGPGGVDTITIHKWLAVGHAAGMILTPLLAPDEVAERRLHQVLGYATYAAFAGAFAVVTFFR
jgi:hypothetical protein